MKQTVGNACGTVGILHAILNARASPLTSIQPSSFIANFATQTADMTPDERAQFLHNDDVSSLSLPRSFRA